MRLLLCAVLCLGLVSHVHSLDNGLALTPPMGFLSWEQFRCNIDCKNDPDNCISEKLYTDMANRLVADGYLQLGYEFVNIDDCWASKERDPVTQRQVADPDRFPNGIKYLADYMHQRGLKLGIYGDFGNYTCGGYPGVYGYLKIDAQTFADWEVDMVKLDGCYVELNDMDWGYPEFGQYLNETGRPIVYSCSWPVYQIYSGIWPDFDSIISHCNLWRNGGDIDDSWESVSEILDYFVGYQDKFQTYAGPGHWNDPDMLIIGDNLTVDQARSQMALWSIMAAPLLMSTDLRTIKPEFKAILQNKDVIDIDQDKLGIQGLQISADGNAEVWLRPISPNDGNQYSYAIALFNNGKDGSSSVDFAVKLRDLGLTNEKGYDAKELFDGESLGTLLPDDSIVKTLDLDQVYLVRAVRLS